MKQITGVLVTAEKQIDVPKGRVFHAIKNNSPGFKEFAEAYFSFVDKGAVKAWKKHVRMTLNLIVPIGEVKFVLFDSREDSPTKGNIGEFVLGYDNYNRLTVPPGIWCGFKGLGDYNMLLNIANLRHDPDEIERMAPADNPLFSYKW